MWKLGSCGGPHIVSILMIDTTCSYCVTLHNHAFRDGITRTSFTIIYYLSRHEVGVTGNILIAGTVHRIVLVHDICLKILYSFNISGMDEATLLKFGSSMAGFAPGMKNFP